MKSEQSRVEGRLERLGIQWKTVFCSSESPCTRAPPRDTRLQRQRGRGRGAPLPAPRPESRGSVFAGMLQRQGQTHLLSTISAAPGRRGFAAQGSGAQAARRRHQESSPKAALHKEISFNVVYDSINISMSIKRTISAARAVHRHRAADDGGESVEQPQPALKMDVRRVGE